MSTSATRLGVAIAAVLAAGIAGAAVIKWTGAFGTSAGASQAGVSPSGNGAGGNPAGDGGEVAGERRPYIVVFDEAALAGYQGEVAGLAPMPKVAKGRKRGKPDLKSKQARDYLGFLGRVQGLHEDKIRRALGRSPKVRRRMQHALNGMVLDLTPTEAAQLRQIDGIRLIEQSVEYELDTDKGPALIGAPTLWQGSYAGATGAQQGEGMVIGVIDTGINFGSPSFAGVDPIDGYQHVNPLGAGTYLGACAAGQPDGGKCNDKLIGSWDFVCDYVPDSAFPLETVCNTPAKYRDSAGAADQDRHGSHTASIAGGNRRDAVFNGRTLRISGVAPRANLVAYDTCYYNLVTGKAACASQANLAAINQAVADGVDVINYSISGGKNPWGDATSLAFLNAVDAGIYVATAAGNDGPGPDTAKIMPWVGITAASTTGREGFSLALDITAPDQVPGELKPVVLTESSSATAPKVTQTIADTTPVVTSPTWGTVDDGCSPFPAGTFQGAIAVISRNSATCTFSARAQNAANAGAIVAIVADYLTNSTTSGSATIPLLTMPTAAATALRNFAIAHPGAVTGGINYPPIAIPNVLDVLASFSSRGPASTFNLVIPHVTAPGYGILAAVSDTVGGADDDQMVALLSGTSMASPHHAGSAALLRQARPTWTVPEVLSALQMTAKPEVFKEDSVTPGTPFDRGSGRIQVAEAVRAGLVLNETKANFLAANPATGGEPASLNLASLAHNHCVNSCSFRRTFRNTLSFRQAWTGKLQGVAGTVSPALFVVNPGESKTVTITVSTNGVPADGSWRFGSLSLTANSVGNPNQPVLRLPIAVSVAPPIMSLTPSAVGTTQAANTIGSVMLNVANLATPGAGNLNFALDNTGNAPFDVVRQDRDLGSNGFRSGIWTDVQASVASFVTDDFTLPVPAAPTSIQIKAFIVSGKSVSAAVTGGFGWAIYADNAGVPAGNPQTSPGAALWSCSAAANAAGVTVSPSLTSTATERTITLNPVAAGCPAMPSLAAGRYWLMAYARTTRADSMAWYATNNGNGGFKTASTGAWSNGACTAPVVCNGLAMQITADVSCGANWMGAATPANGSLQPGSNTNVQLQINTTGLAAGSHSRYVCFASDDPLKPKAAARVNLTVP